jgi:RecA DNA recombination protein
VLPALELDPELASRLVTAQRLEERRGQRGSGLPELDALLGGGWPRGALSELTGRRSSGRTAVMLAALARAARAGEATALVDTGGALDPRAAMACGVPLPRLLWIRCAPAQALKAADLVVSAGGFDVLALDLGDERPRPPVPIAAWVRLKHGAERQGTSVLVATPARAVGAFAAAAVELSAATPHFFADVGVGENVGKGAGGPPLLGGARVKIECLRRASRSANDTGEPHAPCVFVAFTCRS